MNVFRVPPAVDYQNDEDVGEEDASGQEEYEGGLDDAADADVGRQCL